MDGQDVLGKWHFRGVGSSEEIELDFVRDKEVGRSKVKM